AVLYELSIRRAAFRAKAAAGAGTAQVSVTPPRQLVSGFPEELESIILRCLLPDPKDRFAAASDVARALRAVLDSSESRPNGRTEIKPVDGPAGRFSNTPPPPPLISNT